MHEIDIHSISKELAEASEKTGSNNIYDKIREENIDGVLGRLGDLGVVDEKND